MGQFSCLKHISDITELCFFSRSIIQNDKYPIPLNKILFTLFRRGYLKTILVEESPDNIQYADECKGTDRNPCDLIRYHFFRAESEDKIPTAEYGGYCDVRPDVGSIADAFITLETITSGGEDSYVYIPCRCSRETTIPLRDASAITREISGFPYLEKNHEETMCAQAALLGVVQYWQTKDPDFYKGINSAKAINRCAGVDENREGGLTSNEFSEFFCPVLILSCHF